MAEHEGQKRGNQGFLSLNTPRELLHKLEGDLLQIQRTPQDRNVAFNFFITANHFPEWLCQGDAKAAAKLRRGDPLLRLCEHLASGAKHFAPDPRRHTSSKATGRLWISTGKGPDAPPLPGTGMEHWFVQVADEEVSKIFQSDWVEVSKLAAATFDRLKNLSDPNA